MYTYTYIYNGLCKGKQLKIIEERNVNQANDISSPIYTVEYTQKKGHKRERKKKGRGSRASRYNIQRETQVRSYTFNSIP